MGQLLSTPNDGDNGDKYPSGKTSAAQPMGLPAFHDEKADKIICAYIHLSEESEKPCFQHLTFKS